MNTSLFYKIIITSLWLFSFHVPADDAAPIRFYSEIAAPYYWLDKDDNPQGANFELAMALVEQTKLDATIEHLPWARAFHQAMNQPNVVLMSALRTASREKQLQWLGKVHVAKASLIRLAARKNIVTPNVDQAKQFLVGTIRGYGSADFLKKQGFIEGDNLALLANTEQLWTMLFKQRIDLVLSNEQTARYEIQSVGFDPSKIKTVLDVQELSINLEMATGAKTPSEIVEKLQNGLKTLKANGEYERIMLKWNLL